MKRDKKSVLKRLHTIQSKIIDVQQLLPGSLGLQDAYRAIANVIKYTEVLKP